MSTSNYSNYLFNALILLSHTLFFPLSSVFFKSWILSAGLPSFPTGPTSLRFSLHVAWEVKNSHMVHVCKHLLHTVRVLKCVYLSTTLPGLTRSMTMTCLFRWLADVSVMPSVAPGDLAISTNSGPEAFVTVSDWGERNIFIWIMLTSLGSDCMWKKQL